MKTINLLLTAGQLVRLNVQAAYFHLLETSAGVDIDFINNGATFANASGMEGGFFSRPERLITELTFTSATTQTIKFALAMGEGGYQRTAGTINIVSLQGDTLNDLAPVSIGVAATLLVAGDATLKSIRFFNAGAADIYLGGSGVTTANGSIKLAPGATYIETEAAAATWYGISGTAAQSLRIQTVS